LPLLVNRLSPVVLCDTNSSNYIIATFYSKCKKWGMGDTAKRSVQVNVRLSEQDFALIKKAAAKLWPNAVLSNSGILLGLARLAASTALEPTRKSGGSAGNRAGS
jgi:hypothetical protein